MDANFVLDIAKAFLQSPAGLKVLEKAEGVDIAKAKQAIADSISNENKEKRTKNKAERKEARQKKVDEAKKKAGEEIAKYTPYIKIFTTKGRVYDRSTNEPVLGIDVKPQLVVFPVTKEERINPSTKEFLRDSEGNILYKGKRDKDLEDPRNKANVRKIDDNKFVVKTNAEGEWEITFGIPVIDALPDKGLYPNKTVPFVFYQDNTQGQAQTATQLEEGTEGEYAPFAQVIMTQDGEIPQEQNIVSLLDINTASKEAAKEAADQITQFVVNNVTPYLDVAENYLTKLRNAVLKPATVVQTKLLPLAFQLMLYFGIAKEEQANQLQSKCPNPELLNEILRKRNSVVRQINNIYKVIIANTALAFLFLFLSKYLVGIRNTINSLSFPTAVPPGAGVPYSLISRLEKIQELLVKLSDINKDLKKNLIIALIFLIISLIIILRYLKTIDSLINGCTPNADLEEINADLLALQIEAAEQGEPILENVNGFNLSVEVVDKAQVGDLPQRQAIAKDSRGIIVLKGEPSFSAEDQILLDELAFYITINNLKAN